VLYQLSYLAPVANGTETLAAEAEAGYDVESLLARRGKRGRPALGSAPASVESGLLPDQRAPGCGKAVGRPPKTLVLMRDYALARDYRRRGSPPAATTSTSAAISRARSACVSLEVLRPSGRERIWVWLEKRSARRLVWICLPMMLPWFPSVVPLADPSCAARPSPHVALDVVGGSWEEGEQMAISLSRGPEK
jgi:hypothetical protein